MGGWVGGVDKLRIKLSQLSTKVEVEVEAELGKTQNLPLGLQHSQSQPGASNLTQS